MGIFGPPNIEKLEKNLNTYKLIKALKYYDPFIKRRAIEALGRLKSKESVDYIIPFLENYLFREEASKTLGEIGDKRAVKPLTNRLEHDLKGEPWNFIITTMVALAKLDEIDTIMKLYVGGSISHADEFCQKISPYCSKNPRILMPYINSTNWFVRRNAVKILGGISYEKAIDEFIKALDDNNLDVQKAAIFALGKLRNSKSIKPLIALLSTRLSLTSIIVDAFKEMNDERIFNCFCELIEEDRLETSKIDEILSSFNPVFSKRLNPLLMPKLYDKLIKTWEDGNELESIGIALQKTGWEPSNDLDKEYLSIALKDEPILINEEITNMGLKILLCFSMNDYRIFPEEVPYMLLELEKATIVLDLLDNINSFNNYNRHYKLIDQKRKIISSSLKIISSFNKKKHNSVFIRPLMRLALKNKEFAGEALGLVDYLIMKHLNDIYLHDLKQLIKIRSIKYSERTGKFDDGNPDLEFVEERYYDFTRFHQAIRNEIESRELSI